MKKYTFIIILFLFILSCEQRNTALQNDLYQAEKLMEARPDSVRTLLLRLQSKIEDANRADRMNKLLNITLLLLYIICFNLDAQDIQDSVVLRIQYTSQMRYYEDSKDLSPDEKILDIGKYSSHFYSRWAERNRDIYDSVFSRGGKLEDYYAAIDKSGFPNSKTRFNVFKNYPEKGKLTYTNHDLRYFIYDEPMTMPIWEVLRGDTMIVGHSCKKARTTFRGRTWIVWYAMDIPYHGNYTVYQG